MATLETVTKLLGSTLQLGPRAAALTANSKLLGEIPEFDSMAVVSVIAMIEEQFDVSIHDDEISADVFETVGSLTRFVEGKLST
jgi:acyl carrier protein